MPCDPFGVPAFDRSELVPYGHITEQIAEVLFSPPSEEEIENADTGVTFEVVTNDNGEEEWSKIHRLLPANQILIQLMFRTTMRSGNERVADTSQFGTLGGGIGAFSQGLQRFGGSIMSGSNNFALSLCESTTRINLPVVITSDMLDQSDEDNLGRQIIPIRFSQGFVVAVLAVTDEPQPISEEQRSTIGDHNNSHIGGIDGPQFVDQPVELDIINTLYEDEEDIDDPSQAFEDRNRFVSIYKDERYSLFRADNNASDQDHNYAWSVDTENNIDLTSDTIYIVSESMPYGGGSLSEGDVVYATVELASTRYFRQIIRHRADLFDASLYGAATPSINTIGSDIRAWNFQIARWRSPMQINGDEPIKFGSLSEAFPDDEEEITWDTLEGWRLSEAIVNPDNVSDHIPYFYIADNRGILLMRPSGEVVETLVPSSQIQDQVWYQEYMNDSFMQAVGGRIDNPGRVQLTGMMFDLSPHVNSARFDQEKIPYTRRLARAIQRASEDIGIPNLDLIGIFNINRPEFLDSGLFDLRTAQFNSVNQSSFIPSAYAADSCQGYEGSFYDPSDPSNEFRVFVNVPMGDVQTDWILSLPFINGSFGKDSRVYTEYYLSDSIDGRAKANSSIFVDTRPVLKSSLSLDHSPYKDECVVAFNDEENSQISMHKIHDGLVHPYLQSTSLLTEEVSHEKPAFDPERFKTVGYNQIIGDKPSYSHGKYVSNEYFPLCANEVEFSDVYSRRNVDFSHDGSEIQFSLNSEEILRSMKIRFSLSGQVEDIDESPRFSIYFESTEMSIDNLILSLDSVSDGGSVVQDFDCRFYRGSPVRLQGNILNNINIENIEILVSTEQAMDLFFPSGSQTATVYAANGALLLFYNNEESGNISVLYSPDGGNVWFNQDDIIRLSISETADNPYVVSNHYEDDIRLFYRLNKKYLMVKEVKPHWISCQDRDKDYNPPDDDQLNGIYDDDLALENYTTAGKLLRKSPSYFVVANSEDEFFNNEISLADERSESGDVNSMRFVIGEGNPSDFYTNLDDGNFCVYKDNKGAYRLFYDTGNGRMNLKVSNDTFSWRLYARDVVFHKNLESDNLENGDLNVYNPQVLFDKEGDTVYILYFHQDALFMRVFSSSDLDVGSDPDGEMVDGHGGAVFTGEELRKVLEPETDENRGSMPLYHRSIFLVGNIPNQIQEELDRINFPSSGDISSTELQVAFTHRPSSLVNNFTEGSLEVNTLTKPVGYVTGRGALRVFYKSSNGFIYGLTYNTTETTLDVQRRDQEVLS